MNHAQLNASTIMKPTILLVHGAWADGSSWRKVITKLAPLGFEVLAAQIPLRSFAEDVDAVVRLAARQNQPVVLVGHSYGGAVATAASTRIHGTQALVYITGYAPDEGETIGSLWGKNPAHPLRPNLVPDQDGLVWISLSGVEDGLAHDVAEIEEQRLIFATQKPIAANILGEKLLAPGWKTIASWYLVCLHDRMAPAETQRFMADRAGSNIRCLPAGHMPLLSHPQAVADIIAEAAKAKV